MRRMNRTFTLLISSIMALAVSAASAHEVAAQVIGTIHR